MTIPEIISQMTLEEKAALLTGEDSWHIRNCPRLGMERTMVSDGPHGLRKEREDANGGLFKDSIDAVCFPSAVGMASSFHPDALAKLGETLGEECQAEDVSILLGPGVNMKRSPLCGRNFEYFRRILISRASSPQAMCAACRAKASAPASSISRRTIRSIVACRFLRW